MGSVRIEDDELRGTNFAIHGYYTDGLAAIDDIEMTKPGTPTPTPTPVRVEQLNGGPVPRVFYPDRSRSGQ